MSLSQIQRRSASQRAFTLIELLVVVAIISLLAAILFPVFSRVRENARRTSCANTMNQFGLAMLQYAQDFDETYVLSYKWDTLVYPYVGAKSAWGSRSAMFECPSDTIKRTSGSSKRSFAIAGAGQADCSPYDAVGGCALGFAGPLTDNTPATSTRFSRGRRVSEIPDPAGTLEFVEFQSDLNNLGNDNGSLISRPITTSCLSGYDPRQARCGQDMYWATRNIDITAAHNEGWNYLFADGHVKWMRPEKTVGKNINAFADVWPYNPKGMWTIAAGD
jgi:prepilin-type N-terminal cleavage/methylation domain-containing protein/prepilin-type processing-associated H-X9-DG protein